ncbi:hypothetical protein JCM9279_003776 [Rhodotorula babjevae]
MERPANWSWEKKHQDEFNNICKALTSFPVIRAPNWSLPFIIETDASRIGLGAVLSQRFRYEHPESGKIVKRVHPIEFASKGTKPSEKRYSAFLLELVAVKWALKKFKAYIFGRPIELISDCQALAGILSLQNVSPAHACWREYILGHDIIKFVHREGKLNAAADKLSRRADLQEGDKVTPESTIPLSWTDYVDKRDAAEQASRSNNNSKSPSSKQSAASQAPTKLQPQKCQQFGQQVFRAKLQPISVLAPMQLLSMDYFSLPRSGARGYKSVLVIVDYFSRFTWAYKFKEDTGRMTVSALTDLFDRFECPSVLLSDNGSHLNCKEVNTFCEERGVERRTTPTYLPNTNGLVERTNGLLLSALKRACAPTDADGPTQKWLDKLHSVIDQLNNRVPKTCSPRRSTQSSTDGWR